MTKDRLAALKAVSGIGVAVAGAAIATFLRVVECRTVLDQRRTAAAAAAATAVLATRLLIAQ